MPPIAALFICVVFIIVLYVYDARQKREISYALWLPLVWLMIVASRPVSFWFVRGSQTVSADDVLSGSPFDRVVLSILIVAGLLVLWQRAAKWSRLISDNSWIFAWVVYGGLSILWSDFAAVAFKRWIKEIGTFVMVLIVITEQNPFESLKTLLRRSTYALIPLSIVLIKYFRDLGVFYSPWGGHGNLAGVTTDKNALGRLCMISAFFFIWSLTKAGREKNKVQDLAINLLFLLMTTWLLVKANSATSAATLLIGLFTFFALGTSFVKRNVRYLGMLLLLGVVLVIFLQSSFNIIEGAIALMGRDTTLTGRTDLWKDLLALGASPLFGAGYDSFWLGSRLEKLWQKYWWMPNEAHNGYLEVYLNLGLIGLGLMAGILISSYRRIQSELLSASGFNIARFKMAIFMMILFYNITEAAYRGLNLIWLVFLLIALGSARSMTSPSSVPFASYLEKSGRCPPGINPKRQATDLRVT